MRIGSAVYKRNSSMRTGLRVNFVKVHKVNNIIIDCAARNAEPFRKILDPLNRQFVPLAGFSPYTAHYIIFDSLYLYKHFHS